MTGAILAGGENTRIPLLKGHIEIKGRRIIDSAIELLGKVFDRVVISTNTPENYFNCGVPMVGDVINKRGPLTGIFSLLLNTGDDIFVIGCDMPFIKEGLIRHIVNRNKMESRNPGAVIPVFNSESQPLLGIYSNNALKTIEDRLKRNRRGLKEMLTELNVLYIKEADVREIDPEGKSFVNINTMEDYEKVISDSV